MAAKVAKGSIRKSKPVVAKTSLSRPYGKAWTPVVGEDMHFILKTLTEKFTLVGLKKVETQKKFQRKYKKTQKESCEDTNPDSEGLRCGEERAHSGVEELAKPGWTSGEVRRHLAIGINEVTRALEKNQVRLVIVCKSAKPPMITRHITELSASRGVTACQLPRLSENVAPVLGLKSLLALGFRDTSDLFLEEVRAIAPRVPPLRVPWLAGNPKRTDEDVAGDKEDGATSRKRRHPEGAGGVQLQSLAVKKIVPNPNRKRKVKVKKTANKK
ncbi:ribonuclease P protein subunit p38 [Mantella aurantiaca]